MTRHRHVQFSNDQSVGSGSRSAAARGFSLIDLLVSMMVIAVLMGLLLPSLTRVKEAARRVQCASNLRQVAIAVQMYADDHDGLLPRSTSPDVDQRGYQSPETMMLMHEGEHVHAWDGLGWLVAEQYLSTHVIFYCPSHQGFHDVSKYKRAWRLLDSEIVANYDLRPFQSTPYFEQLPPTFALVADGMRTLPDYNHRIGSNVLTADLAVEWRPDNGAIAGALPSRDSAAPDGVPALALWNRLNGADPEDLDPGDDDGRNPGLDDVSDGVLDPPTAEGGQTRSRLRLR